MMPLMNNKFINLIILSLFFYVPLTLFSFILKNVDSNKSNLVEKSNIEKIKDINDGFLPQFQPFNTIFDLMDYGILPVGTLPKTKSFN